MDLLECRGYKVIFTKCLQTASAMGDLQMFPRHTNSTDLFPAAAMRVSSQFNETIFSLVHNQVSIIGCQIPFQSKRNIQSGRMEVNVTEKLIPISS